MTSTTNPAADINALCDRIDSRHYVAGQLYGHDVCGECRRTWPCDAHQMAAALRDLTVALEWYGKGDLIETGEPAYPGGHMTIRSDGGKRARAALTAAVRHLDGGG